MTADEIRELAAECGFELAGVARAEPAEDRTRYRDWAENGFAGRMGYLTDHRAAVRDDPRNLLASARSIVCVGKLYNTPAAYSTRFDDESRGWISRYAWGGDYHDEMRRGLAKLDAAIRERASEAIESRICVDTAPLLERTYARLAGIGWIGKNTCLINQPLGSWFFLGELLLSLAIVPDKPPPDRCGTCTRCIDACPTGAIPAPYLLDATRCISYFTIELREAVPEQHRGAIGSHVFGCDICQDVCPWNRRAPATDDPAYAPRSFAPRLEEMAAMGAEEFRTMFRGTPVTRARYSGFLRNVAIAMGNARLEKFRAPLEKLAASDDPLVAEHAAWALRQLDR
ncbi:MAG: tRNA epoxyqueuosine(34) reductase QueG [Proteobacteria bacterium]|nr:MAG: tRNA epoxyqueuosine(34) reductase QueG [Pseudomonadota bacterium]